MGLGKQTNLGIDIFDVKSAEYILVVLECTAVLARTHEVVVGCTTDVATTNGRARLGTDVTALTQYNTMSVLITDLHST